MIEKLLKVLLNYIKYKDEQDKQELISVYDSIAAAGKTDELLAFIHSEYRDDKDVEEYFFRLLYAVCGGRKLYIECLKCRLGRIEDDDGAWYDQLNLTEQIYGNMFQIGEKDFMFRWHWNHLLLKRLYNALGVSYEPVPKQERNRDRVVIVVSQLLSERHAPTRLALEAARILQKYMDKEVLLLVTVVEGDIGLFQKSNLFSDDTIIYNYVEEYNGRNTLEYKDSNIKSWQLHITDTDLKGMKEALDYIYDWKPAFVWNLDAAYPYAGITREFASYIHMNCSNGYPPVTADLIIDYFGNCDGVEWANRKFLEQHGMRIRQIKMPYSLDEPSEEVRKEKYGISEDTFCIGIVGNRLEEECTEDFLRVMGKSMRENNICLVIYGEASEKLRERIHAFIDDEKVVYMGYQKELVNALQIIDIFVNPPRRGGGGGGSMAMSLGKPVITLPECDVAAFAGEEFETDSLDKFPELIERYRNDHDFYDEQSRLAIRKIEKRKIGDEAYANSLREAFDSIV